MAKQTIDLGTLGGADGTGDSIRTASAKINSNFDEIYANSAMSSQISISGNNIKSTQSNADIFLAGSGTGVVAMPKVLIDSNIGITDGTITTNITNSDLELAPAGTGKVLIGSADINGGNIDNTIIGATTPVAGTFTILSSDTLNADGISITNHEITSTSDADVELETGATGNIVFNGLQIPNTDGLAGQVLKTNGSGTLSFQGHSSLFDNSFISDATATVLGNNSSAQVIDSFSASTYRSVKYHIQISDATADRYRLIDANVTHDGSSAYISVFGGVDNGDGDGSSVYDTIEFSADISGGNVRLLGTVNNTNDQSIKLIRRVLNA